MLAISGFPEPHDFTNCTGVVLEAYEFELGVSSILVLMRNNSDLSILTPHNQNTIYLPFGSEEIPP